MKKEKTLWFSHNQLNAILVACCIVGAAITCSLFCYFTLKSQEDRLFRNQYDSIATQAVSVASNDLLSKIHSTVILSSYLTKSFPDADQWPNVYISEFDSVANVIIEKLPNVLSVGYNPFVTAENAASFENYSAQQYAADPSMPEGTGDNPFGFGIFYFNSTGGRFHDVSGYSQCNSSYELMAPMYQMANGAFYSDFMLLNDFREYHRCITINQIIHCSESQPERVENNTCGATTTPLTVPLLNEEPTTVYYHPIYAKRNGSSVMVGVTITGARWSDTLLHAIPAFVEGVDIIVREEFMGEKIDSTYSIINGVYSSYSAGDTHDRNYASYGKCNVVVSNDGMAPGSPIYKLCIFPRKEFYHQYNTNTPLYAAFFMAGIIMVISLVFFIYDYSMQREFRAKQGALDVKRKFVRFISHEIRTPLNTVVLGLALFQRELQSAVEMAAATALGDGGTNDDKHPELMAAWVTLTEDILESAQGAIAVLNDMLNYDKIEIGMLSLDVSELCILQLLRYSVSPFELQAKQCGIRLELQLPNWVQEAQQVLEKRSVLQLPGGNHRVARVLGDSVRLSQVMRNLVSNALKFTPEGGSAIVTGEWKANGLPNVKPAWQKELNSTNTDLLLVEYGGSYVVKVKDSGAGLSDEQLSKIFGEGIQFNVNYLQAGGGSGLGLHIAKGIVEEHGGTLVVSSDGIGQGSIFTMEIPVFSVPSDIAYDTPSYRVDDEDTTEGFNDLYQSRQSHSEDNVKSLTAGTNTMSSKGSSSSHSLMNKKILVVDDTLLSRKMLTRLLSANGHDCTAAENGQDAINKYLECDAVAPYTTILMDYEMPEMNGPETAKKLRELGCDSMIIGVTGNVNSDDVEYFKAMGADSVLPKPLGMSALQDVWQDLVHKQQRLKGSVRSSEHLYSPVVTTEEVAVEMVAKELV